MKLVTVVVIGVAIGAVVLGIGNSASWRGEAYTASNSRPVANATAVLILGDSVLSTTTSDEKGEFRLTVGWKRNPMHRVMVCKAGSEPSALYERPPPAQGLDRFRSAPSRYPLRPKRPDYTAPAVERLKAVLPVACL